ncbi:MAG TPA: signal peptide peptidase SppA [Vicinamibacterales bacterium]|nr:signal peptide peptidase SppA [Vicinamibacterales bacterium]
MARRRVVVAFTVLGAVTFFLIAAVFVLYLVVGRGPVVPAEARLTLKIGGDLSEVAPDNVVSYLSGPRTPTVRSIVENLRKAKADSRVKELLLKPTGLTTPYWGKVQEIRDAVVDFKKSGKPVYAYLEYGGDRDYYLATAADRVFLMPSSALDVTGVATYELFLRGTLDKIGVFPDLHHIGEYKTASNTFTEKAYTAAHREMDMSLNRDLYDQLVKGIAAGRKKTEAEVRTLLDEGPFLPDAALKAGLVDDVAYEDQVDERLKTAAGGENAIGGDDYGMVSLRSLGLNRGPRIAVLYISGTIVSGPSGYDPLQGAVVGSDTLIQSIRRLRKDRNVRAIVLRIDSPGGSATASDAIWRELMIAKREHQDRPIVASMSDLGASGGYFVALPADKIVAQPSTLTGSIGIFGGKFTTGGVYEKLGAGVDSVSDGRRAEINSPLRPYNADERGKLEEQLRAFYQDFVAKVAESRKKTPEQIDQLGQGRVWTGHQARERGLIDAEGGLDTAIRIAKEAAKIDAASDVEIVSYPAPKSLYELIAEQLSGTSSARMAIGSWLSSNLTAGEREVLRAMHGPLSIFRPGELLALMPVTYIQ